MNARGGEPEFSRFADFMRRTAPTATVFADVIEAALADDPQQLADILEGAPQLNPQKAIAKWTQLRDRAAQSSAGRAAVRAQLTLMREFALAPRDDIMLKHLHRFIFGRGGS